MKKIILILPLLLCSCINQTCTISDCEVNLPEKGKGGFPSIVALGTMIAAKPVSMDMLSPAASLAAQNNSGTTNSNATAGDVDQKKNNKEVPDEIIKKETEIIDKKEAVDPEKNDKKVATIVEPKE